MKLNNPVSKSGTRRPSRRPESMVFAFEAKFRVESEVQFAAGQIDTVSESISFCLLGLDNLHERS
jgi:hypothetical protein